MSVDLLFNGQGQGPVAQEVIANGGRLNVGSMKPFIGKDNRSYIQIFKGGDPKKPENYSVHLTNNTAVLRRDEWKTLDDTVMKISETRLGGIQDLVSNGLVYNIGNGMGSTVLEWHDVSDALEAEATMDGISRAKNDRVVYQTNYLPLPIMKSTPECLPLQGVRAWLWIPQWLKGQQGKLTCYWNRCYLLTPPILGV